MKKPGKRKRPKSHIFRGSRYKIVWHKPKPGKLDPKNHERWGTCSAPRAKGKRIVIWPKLKDHNLLITYWTNPFTPAHGTWTTIQSARYQAISAGFFGETGCASADFRQLPISISWASRVLVASTTPWVWVVPGNSITLGRIIPGTLECCVVSRLSIREVS
jgi:hypothetical protein